MSDKFSIGGTANFQAIDDSGFAIAATGIFDGGGYAKITGITDGADGKKHVELRHYFVAHDGSYIYTEDQGLLTPVTETRYAIAP